MESKVKTKYIKTAMNHIITRIRMDMVMHVAFIKAPTGGFYCLWITPAGDHNDVKWKNAEFREGCKRPNEINLPRELCEED